MAAVGAFGFGLVIGWALGFVGWSWGAVGYRALGIVAAMAVLAGPGGIASLTGIIGTVLGVLAHEGFLAAIRRRAQ